MKKIVIIFILLSCVSFANTNKGAVINPEYKKEIVNWCPSYEETEINPSLMEKYDCGAAGKNYYSKQQYDTALDFAKKIKYIYRTKDINALANIAPYQGFYVNYYKNTRIIEIKSKQQLLKLDKNVLLNKKLSNDINNSNLFWNWRGFMIGKGGIWFFVEGNKVVMLSIYL